MPERAKSLESAFVAGALAAAALLGLNTTAFSATECLKNPTPRTAMPGHWYYRSDRTRNRRCWFFAPAEVTANTPVSPPPTTAGDGSQQSWLPFFVTGFLQPPPPPSWQGEVPQTQPNTIPDRSGEAQIISPKPARSKTVRRERPRVAPPPTTTGVANRRELPEQSAGNEKRDLPLNEADRDALFQDFLKWQLERKLFGRP